MPRDNSISLSICQVIGYRKTRCCIIGSTKDWHFGRCRRFVEKGEVVTGSRGNFVIKIKQYTRVFIHLYSTNQRNAQFYKLIFNFWYLLHVSILVGFILRRTVVYAVWCVLHASVWAVWWIGQCVQSRTHCSIHRSVKHTILHIHLSHWEWTYEVRNT